jgi:hypothetical protein
MEMIPNPDLINTTANIAILAADYADRSQALAHMLGLGFM